MSDQVEPKSYRKRSSNSKTSKKTVLNKQQVPLSVLYTFVSPAPGHIALNDCSKWNETHQRHSFLHSLWFLNKRFNTIDYIYNEV